MATPEEPASKSKVVDPSGQSAKRSGRDSGSSRSSTGHSFRFSVVLLLALVVLALVGFFAAKPVYRAIRVQKGIKSARRAAAHFATNGYFECAKELRLANQLAPDSPEVLEIQADLLSKLHEPNAIPIWMRLATLRPLSLEESYRLLDLALEIEAMDVAEAEIKKLGAIHSNDIAFLRRRLKMHVLEDAIQPAIADVKAIADIDGTTPSTELMLGDVLVRSNNPEDAAMGKRLLLILAQTAPAQQIEAVTLLNEQGHLSGTERNMLARVLNSRAELDFDGQILAASLRMTTDLEQRENIAEEIRTHLPPNDSAAAVRFADWSIRYRVAKPAVAALRPFAKGTNIVAIDLQVQALGLGENWAELEDFLGLYEKQVSPAIVLTVKAWRAAKKGKIDEAQTLFEQAVAKAGPTDTTPQRYRVVAAWAEMAGLPLSAVHAYEPLLNDPKSVVSAARASMTLLASNPDLELGLPIIRRMLEFVPDDLGIQQAYVTYAVVLGRDTPKALALATALHRSDPKDPTRTILLAAAHVRNGNPSEGLSVLESSPIDDSALSDGKLALKAYVLASAQQKDPARRVVRRINQTALRLQEKVLLEAVK